MKTSPTQFDLMVTFMEQHGDLNKPSSNARGKISALRLWEELVTILNSDGSGNHKTIEKWKKVWSDYKNNILKKAARLHRAASGTGGGPADFSKLTDLELRVLNIIGMQVATGLLVAEAGIQAVNMNEPISAYPQGALTQPLCPSPILPRPTPRDEAGPSTQNNTVPLFRTMEEVVVESPAGERYIAPPPPPPSPSPLESLRVLLNSPFEEVDVQDVPAPRQMLTPTQGQAQLQPALTGQTPPRRGGAGRPTRIRRSPRRLVRPAHTEQAAQHFLNSEEQWRKFKIEQHRDYMALRREQNRLRDMEIQVQREWQNLGSRVLDSIDKLVNKFCKD